MKKLVSLFKNGATVTLAGGLLWAINNLFDWVLYPLVIYVAGNIEGAVIMTLLSVPFNYALIRAYDKIGLDLFLLERAKGVGLNQTNNSFVNRVKNNSRWLGFVMLSFWDPIPAVIYIRKETNAYKGLSRSDWLCFIAATLIANATWIGITVLSLETASLIASN